jgi:L-rhamnose mutarotase
VTTGGDGVAHSLVATRPSKEATVQRACFLLKVREDRLDEYVERHRSVWPEMLEALSSTGWTNYSLFLRPDGLLVGYVETPDLQAALDGMAATDVNARWQAEMAEFFESLDGRRPDDAFQTLREVFHLA